MSDSDWLAMTEEALALLIELHLEGQRQGPGSDEDTRLALQLCRLDCTRPMAVADIGCGTGASTLVLAEHLNARITAVDFAQPFLDRLVERAEALGLANKISPVCASMDALPFEPASLDLIWAEGAIYNMGFSAGLKAWCPFLKSGGLMALSEITWLGETRPDALTDYWQTAYPEITTVAGNVAKLETAGLDLIGYFPLSSSAWMDNYYHPLLNRMEAFLLRHGHSEHARALVAAEKSEIDLYVEHQAYFSYGFYISRTT